MNNLRQQSSVLFGDKLNKSVPAFNQTPFIYLPGTIADGTHVPIPFSTDILSKHMMLLGGIGTGKTNALYHLISRLKAKMGADDVMVIFDTKGDFYREFYRPGDVVISNDCTATGTGGLDYWNIFNEIDGNGSITDEAALLPNIIEIAKSLFAEACEKTTQIFFPNAAKDIFMAILLHFFRAVEPRQRTNQNLVAFINGVPAEKMKAMLESYNDLRAMSSYISNPDSPQTQGVLSELQQVTREVFLGNFAKQGTLSIRNLVKNKGGKVVFIEYDLSIGNMLKPIYSLLFDLAIKEALGRNRSEGNVYFICDEFKLLPYLQHIDDAVNFGRSLGIKFVMGIQNVEQIYDNYGAERARSIFSGFMTSFCFRVNDAESREFIKGLYGKNMRLDSYLPVMKNKGMVEETREGYVVEDWDITNLEIGEAIVGIPGREPFVFRFDLYQERG